MSNPKEKGEISQKLINEIEWTFEDIFSYTKEDECYDSPKFSVPGSKWFLTIYPNGQIERDSVGWISLYLMLENDACSTPKMVNYFSGVKKNDGKVEVMMNGANQVFNTKCPGWGTPKFLHRSKLSERKTELAPFGDLTVVYTMKVKDILDCTSRLIELSDDFKNKFVSKEGCDATLKVEEQQFPVHKSVLSSRSAVFKSMFQADMKEKNTGVVDIQDCHPDAFRDFLVFIYSGRFENSSGDACGVYKIAHKYCVDSLKSASVHFLLDNVQFDSVLDVCALGHYYDEPELKRKSQEFVNEHFADVILTDKSGSFFKENPTLAHELITNMAKDMKNRQSKK